mmetsp:Transcript_16455/g.35767  ORF Transcript_16455/g.35767 Transcript_16455/m.35767 type:complete len:349 (+) Transcript_16455:176-1222(+)
MNDLSTTLSARSAATRLKMPTRPLLSYSQFQIVHALLRGRRLRDHLPRPFEVLRHPPSHELVPYPSLRRAAEPGHLVGARARRVQDHAAVVDGEGGPDALEAVVAAAQVKVSLHVNVSPVLGHPHPMHQRDRGLVVDDAVDPEEALLERLRLVIRILPNELVERRRVLRQNPPRLALRPHLRARRKFLPAPRVGPDSVQPGPLVRAESIEQRPPEGVLDVVVTPALFERGDLLLGEVEVGSRRRLHVQLVHHLRVGELDSREVVEGALPSVLGDHSELLDRGIVLLLLRVFQEDLLGVFQLGVHVERQLDAELPLGRGVEGSSLVELPRLDVGDFGGGEARRLEDVVD